MAKAVVTIGAEMPSSWAAWFMIWPTVMELRCSSSSGFADGSTVSTGSSARSAASRISTSRLEAPSSARAAAGPAAVAAGCAAACWAVRSSTKSSPPASQGLAKNRNSLSSGSGRVKRSANSCSWRTGAPIVQAAATAPSSPPSDTASASVATAGTAGRTSAASDLRICPGPTSISRSTWPAIACNASVKRTGWTT